MLVHDAMLMHDAKIALMLVAQNSASGDVDDVCMCASVADEVMLRAEARGNFGTRC